ncbi:MAG: hypothetical protein J7L14_03140, partial [Candidatus Diapherotrites archaeon]|nr:hypothetical protein [Candidatus Diapherotrites archaeon]
RLRIGEIFEPVSIREQISKELDHIAEIVKTIDAKRLVIDPTTAFGIWFERAMLRNVLFNFTDKIRELGCTTILTSETKNRKDEFSAFGVEGFIADGVIALYFFPPHRNLFIRKMRGTNHDKNVHPFQITEKGIEINAKETVLWEALR